MAIGQFMPGVVPSLRNKADVVISSVSWSLIMVGYERGARGTLVSSTLPPHLVLGLACARYSTWVDIHFQGDVRSAVAGMTVRINGPSGATLVIPPQTWLHSSGVTTIEIADAPTGLFQSGQNTTMIFEDYRNA